MGLEQEPEPEQSQSKSQIKINGTVKSNGTVKIKIKGCDEGPGLRRRLRGERPRSGKGPRTLAGRLAAVVAVGLPARRRLKEPDRPGGIKPDRRRCWLRNVRLDPARPARLAAPADATGRPNLGYGQSGAPVAARVGSGRPPAVSRRDRKSVV